MSNAVSLAFRVIMSNQAWGHVDDRIARRKSSRLVVVPAVEDSTVAIGLDDALLGWLVASAGDSLVRRLRGDPARAALRAVVKKAIAGTVAHVAGDLDDVRAAHLRESLGIHDSGVVNERVQVANETELRDALYAWTAALDHPEYGEPGYLTGLGLTPGRLADALASRIIAGIEHNGRLGGVLNPLAEWLWRDKLSADVDEIKGTSQQTLKELRVLAGRHSASWSGLMGDVQRYDELLAESVVGREWLLAEIDAFLQENDRGYFLIEADAGMGKTTFAYWLSQLRGWPAHFAQFDPDAGTGKAAARNLGAQLIAAWNLSDLAHGDALTADVRSLRNILRAAARQRDGTVPETPIVLVVDALDGGDEPADGHLPLGLPDRLPAQVYVVATFRTGGLQQVPADSPYRHCRLDGLQEENLADLRQHLAGATAEPWLTRALTATGIGPAQFTEQLLERSGGIWVYVHYVLEEIKRDPRGVLEISRLPRGLTAYYHNNIKRLCDGMDRPAVPLSLLATLAVAAEPLDAPTLASLAGIDDSERVERILDDRLRPYCSVHDTVDKGLRRFEVYHSSLREYLAGQPPGPWENTEDPAAGTQPDAVVSLRGRLAHACRDAHQRICDRYLTTWGGLDHHLGGLAAEPALGEMDGGYGLRWLARHLLATGQADELHRLLACDRGEHNVWFKAHENVGDIAGYLRDVARARDSTERLSAQVRYALIEASIASVSTTLPPALISKLVTRRVWTPSRALSHIQRMADETRQAQALALIASYLPSELMGTGLEVAKRCRAEENRAVALHALIPELPGELLADAKKAVLAIKNEELLPTVTMAIAQRLPKDELRSLPSARDWHTDGYVRAVVALFYPDDRSQGIRAALAEAQEIENRYERGLLVAALPEFVFADAFGDVIAILETIPARYLDAPLIAAAEHVPAERLGDLLDFARRYAAVGARLGFYQYIARQRLTAEHLPAVLQLCQAEPHVEVRVEVFVALVAPILDTDRAREFLAPFRGYIREWSIFRDLFHSFYWDSGDLQLVFRVVGALLNHLPKDEARDAVKELILPQYFSMTAPRDRDERDLAGLASYLPPDLRGEAFRGTCMGLGWFEQDSRAVAPLLPLFAPFSDHEVAEAFDVAATGWWPESRLVVAEALAPHLPDRLLGEASERAMEFPLEESCFRTITELAEFQPLTRRDDTADSALAAAVGIKHRRYRARAVAALAPILRRPELIAQAFEIVRSVEPWLRPPLLDALAPVLPPDLLRAVPDAIRDAASFRPMRDMPRILGRLSAAEYADVIDVLVEYHWHYDNCRELSHLAPCLSTSQARRLWQKVAPLANKGETLSALVSRLAADERPTAVDEILAVSTPHADRDEIRRPHVLARLARAAPTERLTEALREFLTRPGHWMPDTALAELAPILPGTLLEEAFQYARSDDYDSCLALAKLAPRLSGSLLTQAITHVSEQGRVQGKAAALTALARQLPSVDHRIREEVLTKALEAAISDPLRSQLEGVMADLIPQLPERLRPEAIKVAIGQVRSDLLYHTQTHGEKFDRLRATLKILRGPELKQIYDQLHEIKAPRVRAHAKAAVIQEMGREREAGLFADGLPQDWPGDLDRASLLELIAAAAWWIAENADASIIDEVVAAIFDAAHWWP